MTDTIKTVQCPSCGQIGTIDETSHASIDGYIKYDSSKSKWVCQSCGYDESELAGMIGE